MMVSLSTVLTTIAVVWLVILLLVCICDSKEDSETVLMCFVILFTLLSCAILLYRIGSLIFSLIGG